ncbi:3-deoxy-manno-octulosonate cytidylyltransferase [Aminivibrio sp.]|jgi:3-deoxy-manno-octulosonate cytidylyltransferase (CMP-KDO synthetase)|uniref:3-deoxy-manno-octulosonate cytidylyltransferase n=1 Tax=Aminivibrio sp. TaxID=1872489 RepID=UPI001A51C8E8|nr:3-deoxy-manno-octulosonate cytidylyltransferase [Aminivibrio sp.]MBL3539639.1 3-deoxy-manno-octulosonate cytidylyltransferase [Aminivibrio sp.]MDK2958326.1 3-deoxy-manno-octulosonate cytidylyltransferase synthetase [Synergistaceae bacterium]
MKTLAVIPARFASTRLPGKPLLPVGGVPLVVRVLRRVKMCSSVDRIIVAADDDRIAEAVRNAGGECMLTPPELPSGGDRVAWVAGKIPSDLVLNVQVDDPLVGPDMIDSLTAAMDDPVVMLALLSKRIEREEEVLSPNIVKMVFDAGGRALYFSRSPIPYPRSGDPVYYKHIGPYCWRRDFLLKFSSWEQTPLEKTESLEMLRVLERGHSIACVPVERDTIEIDTPEDAEALERYLELHPDCGF